MPSSRGSSRPRDQTHVSYASCVGRQVLYHWSHLGSLGTLMKVKVIQLCLTLCDPHGLYSPWNTPCQNTGVGSCSLLQGIFPIQESNPGLLHCRQILNRLSSEGSPNIISTRLKMTGMKYLAHSRWPTRGISFTLLHGP